ncbi:MAG: flagellar biosynthesis protein FlhF [Pseudomonadota bacterium]
MKIKRYFATDMRQAIQMVREAQGPDAVILSNRRVDGGVEIVAAVDYDESVVAQMAQESPVQRAEAKPSPSAQETPAQRFASTAEAVAERARPTQTAPTPKNEPAPTAEPERAPRTEAAAKIEWSQEPTLVAMREEIQMLRGMLESQLNGLAWNNMKQQNPQRTKLLERLLQMGLHPALCRTIADNIHYQKDMNQNWRQALKLLAGQLPVTHDDILNHGGLVALVGPTGAGKTTSVAKLAARYTLRHGPGRVALVTTDSYRIGAHHQLRSYGQILGAPVHVARDGEQLREILVSLQGKSLVLIDTAGMSQRDIRLSEQFGMLQQTGLPIRSYAVMSASSQRRALEEVIQSFSKVELDGAILTKLDEAAVLGEALSVLAQNQLPVAYISDGQRVPEDLHPARSNSLVNRCVSQMQHTERPAEESLMMEFGRMAG